MVCVQDIPSEIWLEGVVPRVNPIDVMFLSQTSGTFWSMLSRKPLWADILRSTCLTHGLFLASYPIDDMTLSELRRASTGPYRWDSRVRRRAVPLEELKAAPPLPILASRSLGDWSRYEFNMFEVRAFLVPGGRFLVVFRVRTSPRATRLELWDLGIPISRTTAAPKLLTYRDIETKDPDGTDGELLVTTSREDPDELRVAVYSELYQSGVETRVFSISLTQSAPGFKPLASAYFMGESEPFIGGFIHGDFMAFRSCWGDFFTLWNYVEGWFTKVAFSCEGPDKAIRRDAIILTNDHVLHLGDGVSMWSLSRLRDLGEVAPSGAIFDSSLKTHLGVTPDWTRPLPVRVQRTDHTSTILSPVRCTIGIQPSVTFDILTGRPGLWVHPITFHRYTLTASPVGTGAPFHFAHVEKGILPFGYLPEMVLLGGKIRNNGVSVACIAPRSRSVNPDVPTQFKTFICTPTQAVTDTNALDGNEYLRSPPSVDDMKGVLVTPLEPLRPLASCWASGRFIYHHYDPELGTTSLLLANYL